MSVEAGGTFKCNDEAFIDDTQHLGIIVSDPAAHPDQVVIVNVSSSTNKRYDPACELRVSDHWFITHASFVYYRGAVIVTVQKLRETNLSHKTSLSAEVLQRVRDGAGKSKRIAHHIKKALIDQGIISVAREADTD